MPLRTRSKAKHFSISSPGVLPVNPLPTTRDVVNYVRLLAGETKSERAATACLRKTAEAVIAISSSESIPIIQTHNVTRKIKQAYERFRRLNKTPKKDRDTKTKLILSEEKLFNKLFDIARCRCKDLRRCNCPMSSRVPPAEIAFLRDQRGARKMTLGGIDYEETSKRRKTANLRQKRERNEGRDDADQAGPSHVTASLPTDIDEPNQRNSSVPIDTSDSSNEASDSGSSDCTHEPNNDHPTDTAQGQPTLSLVQPCGSGCH